MTDIDITLPENGDELEEMLNDPAKLEEVVGSGRLTEFLKAYARRTVEKDEGIAQQIKDEAGKVYADMLRENGVDAPVDFKPTPPTSPESAFDRRHYLNSPNAMGAKVNGVVGSLSEFFQTVWHNSHEVPEAQEKRAAFRNAFESDVPSAGGFLIPEEFRSDLLRVALETSVVRPRATVIPMGSSRVAIPSIDSTSNATTTHGGITTAWSEEAATLSASEAKFGRTVLDAKKLTAYAEVPNELLADSAISFEALINTLYPEALAFAEDDGFVQGSGAGEPQGFTNAAAEISVAKETGQAASTIVFENCVKMLSRMLPGSLGRAVWVCHHDTLPELATMALSVGTGGGPIWVQNGADGLPMNLLGRPIVFSEKVSTLGTVNDINLVDLSYYLIGDRQSMSAASSEHVNFASDTTAFRLIERVDGRPWINSSITPRSGSTTTSPFVTLATRA